MSPELAIVSAAVPGARIEGSRMINEAPAALPARALGLGPFTVAPAQCGLPQVVDATGQAWGVFANEHLARQTAARLSQ